MLEITDIPNIASTKLEGSRNVKIEYHEHVVYGLSHLARHEVLGKAFSGAQHIEEANRESRSSRSMKRLQECPRNSSLWQWAMPDRIQ